MAKEVNYLEGGRIEGEEWFALVELAQSRGFEHLLGRQQTNGKFQFLSGMTQVQLTGLFKELRIGGWTGLPTSEKRHFFRKRGDMLDNPSLCEQHQLDFCTNLDHDENESDMCDVCLERSKALGIQKVYPEI